MIMIQAGTYVYDLIYLGNKLVCMNAIFSSAIKHEVKYQSSILISQLMTETRKSKDTNNYALTSRATFSSNFFCYIIKNF